MTFLIVAQIFQKKKLHVCRAKGAGDGACRRYRLIFIGMGFRGICIFYETRKKMFVLKGALMFRTVRYLREEKTREGAQPHARDVSGTAADS